ncbi:unnamed protein product [Phytophthora lilii]|uniref:Unnamed protein product n=1 Tax=Phytophthora lilii TaxID=2077276 RepID=A0A9W6TYK4_9STRA|nr:unnamed protein product [Phytophthora lilii]
MATQETVSNPGAVTASKPLHEVFPVRQVLGMLQRNERLSEQPAPRPIAPAKESNERQENQDSNSQPAPPQSEDIVSESPPYQPDDASQESNPATGEPAVELNCPRCGKDFSSGTSLRIHLSNVYPCDPVRPTVLPKDDKLESKTCYKCGKTFASWQGLRGHLNRIKPCNQEKATSTIPRRRPAATRTCTKCGKTFSSPQSLRIHMNRVKPCDQDKKSGSAPTTPPPATAPPTTSLMMNTDQLKKEAERKANARYQARKAYLKKRGRLGELGDPPSSLYSSGDDRKTSDESTLAPDLKRSASDGPLLQIGSSASMYLENKRLRVEEKGLHDNTLTNSPSDVSGLTQPSIPMPLQPIPRKKTSPGDGSFVHRSNKKNHGGDLLAGGCSCPPCVRRWARTLMNRMQQLEDEVIMLRQNKTASGSSSARGIGAAVPNKPTPVPQMSSSEAVQHQAVEIGQPDANAGAQSSYAKVDDLPKPVDIFRALGRSRTATAYADRTDPSGVMRNNSTGLQVSTSRTSGDMIQANTQQQSSPATAVLQALGADRRSLMDAYSYMNEQIQLNEKTVEDSTGHIQILMGIDHATAMDFRKQVAELRTSITAEKSKRDVTVASLIAHELKPRRNEFKTLLESTEMQDYPKEEEEYHTKWSEIDNQVSLKDKILSELEKQMASLGDSGGNNRSRYAQMGELSSKIAAEYAAKMALESYRESIYLGLVKSSTRIRSLVRSALL